MTIGVRFTLTAGDVDFYTDEIQAIPVRYRKDIKLLESQVGAPYMYYAGDSFREIRITFLEVRSDVKAKINQIINEDDEMTVYYDYAYDGAGTSTTVIYSPNGKTHVLRYHFGELAVAKHTLNFLEV